MNLYVTPLLLVIIAAHFINTIFVSLVPNLISSFIATGLYITTVMIMFRARPIAVWLLLPFIILQVSVLLSLNVIEAGGYMAELGQSGHASTAAVSYELYSVIFLCTALVVFQNIRRRQEPLAARRRTQRGTPNDPLHPIFHLAFLAVASGCIVYLLVAGLRTGFPLLTHTDRFAYRRIDADIITLNLLNLKALPLAALGVAVVATGSRLLKATYYILAVLLIVEFFLFGDKFFSTLLAVLFFLTPAIVHETHGSITKIVRYIPAMTLAVGGALVVTFIVYSNGSSDAAATLDRFGQRFTEQGELWFVSVEHSSNFFSFDAQAVSENLASVFTKNPSDFIFSHRLAAFYFVHRYWPGKLFLSVIHNAGTTTPTMLYEAYGLVLFGYLGLLFQMIVTGGLAAVIIRYYHAAIMWGNPFFVLLPTFILNQLIKLVTQATLYNLISIPTFKICAAFLALELLLRIVATGLQPGRRDGAHRAIGDLPSSPHILRRNPND